MPGKRSIFLFRAFLLFVFLVPITQFWSVRVLVATVFISLVWPNPHFDWIRLLRSSWDILMYLGIYVAGLLYSDDLGVGWRVLETSLSLVALPLVYSKLEDFKKNQLHYVFYAFASGLFVASLVSLSNAIYLYASSSAIDVFFFDRLTGIIDSHPTYMAYYLIAVITFGLYLLYYEKRTGSPIVIVPLLTFFFLILMLTGGITAFVSMLFVLAFFVLKFLLENKTSRQTITFGVVVSLIICMFVFNEMTRNEQSLSVRDDSWERLVLWESAIKANPNIFLGVGTGDYKAVLNEYYISHNLSRYADSNYNAHNQFIEMFFSNGLLGLACLLLLVGRPLYLSVRNGNVLGTLIFFPFFIYGMTEVFFGRYQGVVFFALMHQSFIAYYQSYEPAFSLKRA